jgi:hypothetical protein
MAQPYGIASVAVPLTAEAILVQSRPQGSASHASDWFPKTTSSTETRGVTDLAPKLPVVAASSASH